MVRKFCANKQKAKQAAGGSPGARTLWDTLCNECGCGQRREFITDD